jgi:hypothetical protein
MDSATPAGTTPRIPRSSGHRIRGSRYGYGFVSSAGEIGGTDQAGIGAELGPYDLRHFAVSPAGQ